MTVDWRPRGQMLWLSWFVVSLEAEPQSPADYTLQVDRVIFLRRPNLFPSESIMTTSFSETATLADNIVDRIEELILEAEKTTKPLEVDPYRSRLFELFVTAEGVGYLKEGCEPDLTADGLCRLLGARWGLANAAREAMTNQSRMPQEHLSKMRLLWSVMRMWMEWDYAWQRWNEFHESSEETA